MKYPIVIRELEHDEGGGFLAELPDLPGCMADGETIEEAARNAEDAANVYLYTGSPRLCCNHAPLLDLLGVPHSAFPKVGQLLLHGRLSLRCVSYLFLVKLTAYECFV